MQLRTVLILLLLVGSANGHLGMILGLVGKIVGGIIKSGCFERGFGLGIGTLRGGLS